MCLRPIPVIFENQFGVRESIDAPCGKCIECVQRDQNDWKCRMIEESKNWPYCYFFTLTYRDSSLPVNIVDCANGVIVDSTRLQDACGADYEIMSTACKKDVQDLLKRFRVSLVRQRAKELGYTMSYIKSDKLLYKRLKPNLKYFICAEYGPNGTHRPHYHGVIFTDVPQRYMSIMFADWHKRHGFVKWSRVVPRSDAVNACSAPANYVSKYCCKGEFASRVEDIEAGFIQKAWRISSKGLGASYVDKHRSYHIPSRRGYTSEEYVQTLLDRRFYFDGSYKYHLPRYYIERLYYRKKTEIKPVYNYEKKKFEAKKIYRYVSTSPVQLKIKAALRELVDARYRQRIEEIRLAYPTYSDSEVYRKLAVLDRLSIEAREASLRSKLNRFYFDNSRKTPDL